MSRSVPRRVAAFTFTADVKMATTDYTALEPESEAPRLGHLLAPCLVTATSLCLAVLLLSRVALQPWLGAVELDGQPPVACIFIHGAGSPDAAAPSASDPIYWGRVNEFLPRCSVFRFMHEDTLHAGWEDLSLQMRTCALLSEISEALPPSQVVIFAHSLGNLLLAGALDRGLCSLPSAAAWYAVAAPWAGSRAADRLPEVCAGLSSGAVGPLVRSLARRQRFCDGVNSTPSVGYLSLSTANLQLRDVAARWQARVNGTMCGDSAFGLWSADSMELQALADVVRFGERNDGAVPTASCHPPGVEPARTHNSEHFTAAANHYDLTCRHGDASLPFSGDDRMPCSWYVAMLERALATS